MKKLTNLLLVLTLTSIPALSQDSIRSENLLNFIGKGAKPSRYDLEMFYDFNKDSCYSEIYVGKIDSCGEFGDLKDPLWYILYIKRNGRTEVEEIIVDKEEDGINGNEIRYIRPKEIQVTSKKKIEI